MSPISKEEREAWRAEHSHSYENPGPQKVRFCSEDKYVVPCPTIRLLDEVEKLYQIVEFVR